jgi:hypothetical protein
MADQKNQGGQKKGNQDPKRPEQQQGTTAGASGERSDRDKREDQMSNPDDNRRQATDQQR